ncbi:MAG: transcription antitermination factor NusB [Clostridia bacterium]|nr:transcription antitermination factor NusB [Clostridia bacterium]
MTEKNNSGFSRTKLREQAFCLLFGYSLCKPTEEELSEYYENAVRINGYGDTPYLQSVFYGVVKEADQLDQIIEKYAVGWKKNRISPVSLNLMRLCIYESKYIEDVPAAVAMNEAVELAKKYDTEQAPAFINGILNAAVKGEGLL